MPQDQKTDLLTDRGPRPTCEASRGDRQAGKSPLWAWLTILVIAAASPLVFLGDAALESNTDEITQWLPDSRGDRQQYDQFVEQFGGDGFVLVSWPGCTLSDERLTRLAGALTSPEQQGDHESDSALIRRVITGSDMLERLTSEPVELSLAIARRRMQGIFIGPDGTTTCALVLLTDEGQQHQEKVLERIYRIAERECGLDRETLRLGGSAYEAVVLDHESERALRAYLLPITCITLLLTWWCFRSLRLVIIVLAVAAFCRSLSMAIVYFTDGHANAVLIVLPVLVYVLTVSGAVHLVNYYRDVVQQDGQHGAAWRALQLAWLPCVLAAGSTAIGLISLCVSQIGPVRSFGVYGAFALLVSVVVLLAVVPAALRVWPDKTTRPSHNARKNNFLAATVAETVIRWRHWLAVPLVVTILALAFGLSRTTTTVKIERFFREDTILVRNYRWIEEHIGSLVSIEILVNFDNDCELDLFKRMALVAEIQQEIAQVKGVSGTMSALSLSPPIPKSGGMRGTIRRTVFAKKWEKERPWLVEEGLLADGQNEQAWRITTRIPATVDLDYGNLGNRLRDRVANVVRRHSSIREGDVSVTYTGIAPMVHRAQEQLLADLTNSFALALLLISPTMMVILRSPTAGLLAMIPNVAPIATVFGALGWLGIPVDVGSVLTASVALGVAVDDTLHVLTWYTRAVRAGRTPRQAIGQAYQRCGTAMIQTTIICGLGLLVVVHSNYVPASQFAWLTSILLLAALASDFVLLPLILVSPMGKVFLRGVAHRERTYEPAGDRGWVGSPWWLGLRLS
jgi:predicted RND superfamily exporter protein